MSRIIRYYNNPGLVDHDLVERLKRLPDNKHYHYVEQARRLSDQKILNQLLENAEKDWIFETEDLTTFVANSLSQLVEVLERIKEIGCNLTTESGLVYPTNESGYEIPIDALSRYMLTMRSVIRRQLGRPRAFTDLDRLAALRAQGLSSRELAKQLGMSKTSVQRYLKQLPPRPGIDDVEKS